MAKPLPAPASARDSADALSDSAQTLDVPSGAAPAAASDPTAAPSVPKSGEPGSDRALSAFDEAFGPPVPERIGPYRILRLIGQGGMGAVYEAEQQQPKRRVALKVIRAGLLSRAMLRRFTFEVEMLGRLQHPGIAQIHEAGTAQTDAGVQPYFAMEFVDGRPLSKHAAELELREKLELLAKVADAIHFAHQNGVIHRDLKPDNILVDGHGQPKVLDFGVARSTNADVQATMQTETGAIIGTLSYMSPEQAAGEVHHIDVRSDVYALGVIAYQLLTGRLPYSLPRDSLVTALRLIREIEPVPVGKEHKELRGDIETILAQAMEKERERRYQSANDFASDIRRHLSNEPISARPADTMYHLSKFVRRNRILVSGVAATFVMLIAGLAGTTWQWGAAVTHRREAEQHARDAQVKLAASYLAQGNALALAGRWADAKRDHMRGLETSQALGESVLPAKFAFWEDRYHSPESLAVWQARPEGRALAFSPDGLQAVSGGGRVRLWDVGRGTVLKEANCSDERGGSAVAFDRAGRRVAVGTAMGGLRLWNFDTGEMDWSQHTHAAPVMAVATVEDEGGDTTVISAALDHSIAVWDGSGTLQRRFGPPPPERPTEIKQEGAAAISSDGLVAAIADDQGNLSLWSTADGVLLNQIRAHEGTIHGLKFSADGRFLVTASADKTLQLWDAADGRHIRSFNGHDNGVASVAISLDGTRLLSGSWDQTVRLWDIGTGATLRTFTGHTDAPRACAFSPDGTLALSISTDGTIRPWSLRSERHIRTFAPDATQAAPRPRVNAVSASPEGRLIVAASADGMLRLWDASTGLLLRSFAAHEGPATAAAFSQDGRSMLSGGADGTLKLWPVFAPRGETPEPALVLRVQSDSPAVICLAVAPDGRTAISGGPDGIARVWDLASGDQLHTYQGPAGSIVTDVHYSADTALAVAVFNILGNQASSTVDLWNTQTGRLVKHLSQESGYTDVDCVAFSPDGKLVAGGGWAGRPRLWPSAQPYGGAHEFTGDGHGSTMLAAVISPDARYLVTGGWDNTVHIWDMQRRSSIRTLAHHERPVVAVAMSGDGRTALSGSWDGTIKLWDLASVDDFADQEEAVAAAMKKLQKGDDAAAVHLLANWYARRGADALAVHMLTEAAARGERISHLLMARCRVSLGEWEEARRAYELARATSEAPAEYVELCLEALPEAGVVAKSGQ